jgi:16S rRNA (cytosine1402-N4)-methyltransferase
MERKKSQRNYHEPVMVHEVLQALEVKKFAHSKVKAKYIDATLGYAGHAIEIIKNKGRLLGIEADRKSLEIAQKKLDEFVLTCPTPEKITRESYTLVHGNFRDIDKIALETGFGNVNGILFDLGVSTPQLTSVDRGFSFSSRQADLDMRIDRDNQGVTAADLLNILNLGQLIDLFKKILGKNISVRLSREVVKYRSVKKFETVGDLADLIKCVISGKRKLDISTLPFLALRIAVNSELENLEISLPKAFALLHPGGRLAVISFHSGEDKIVKNYFKKVETEKLGKRVNSKALKPTDSEIKYNPRSRSAKLRIIKKI